MKALILCAGFGTRLRPLTYTGAKHLIPVANKPILHYALEAIVESGITEIGLVVGGPTRQQIEDDIGDGRAFGARVRYIAQESPLGLGHAVAVAKDFIQDSPFIVYLGDNLIHGGIQRFVQAFTDEVDAQILVAKVPDPRRFGVAEVTKGKVVRVIEKPTTMRIDLAIVGVYAFRSSVFDAISRTKPSARGELEITDAIQALIDAGRDVRAVEVSSWWADTGRPEDVLEVNRRLLHELEPSIRGQVEAECELTGPVSVGEGTVIRGSMIRGPVAIGKDCVIEDSYVGPYTAISDDCTLRQVEIEFSILLPGVTVDDMPVRIDASLLGNRASLTRNLRPTRTMRFVLGNDSQVSI